MIRLIIVACIASGFCGLSLAHQGHSEAYKEYLNQPKPEWLNIGEPITVKSVEVDQKTFLDAVEEHERVKVTRHSVSLPEKDITIKFENTLISWYSGGDAAKKMLSPDGSKLLVETAGKGLFMYEILGQNSYREIKFDFPEIAFDSAIRGTISGWRSAADGVLIAESEIENEDTGEHENNRVYAYHWKEKILSRLNLDGLNLKNLEDVEIVDVSQNSNYLKINIGGEAYTLKLDLKSVPEFLKRDAFSKRSDRIESPKTGAKPVRITSSKPKLEVGETKTTESEKKSSLPWIITGVLLLGILALLFKSFKRKSSS